MSSIILSDGSVALVDAEDMPLVDGRVWHPEHEKLTTYARCSIGNRTVRMHRLIVGALPGEPVDHWNGDGLDNRRHNLRKSTSQQNASNRRTRGPKSGFKGVYPADRSQRWKAIITVNYQRRHLGHFPTAEAAARAYDAAAREAFGPFAALNFAGRLLDGVEHNGFPEVTRG